MRQSQKYAIHLDNLRQKNKISIEEFCFEIVDSRTYRRYKTGKKTLTHLKVIDFCRKLKISTTDFYFSAREQDSYEFQLVNKLYGYAVRKDYDKFKFHLKEVMKKDIDDIQNQRFLDFCIFKVNFETKTKPDDILIQKLSEIANYPDCLNYSAFDFVSLLSLLLIAEIEIKYTKEIALNKLVDILNNPDLIYTSSETNTILPSLYSNVSLFLLRLEKFNETIIISDRGITYSLRYSDLSGLAHLYYSKSYASLKLGKKPDAELNALLCIMTAMIKKNKYEIDMFEKALKKDLNIDPLLLFSKYRDKLTKS